MSCNALQMVGYHHLHNSINSSLELTHLGLPALVNWLSTQLTKQKKTDFKPRNDDLSFARVNTEPCVACCDTLERVRDAAKANLSGKNLEVFLTEIGIAFHRCDLLQLG